MYPEPIVSVGSPAIDIECEVLSAAVRHGRDDPTTQPVASSATFELVGALPPEAVMGAPIVFAASGSASSESLYPDAPTPPILVTGGAYTMASRFTVDEAGAITHIRWYYPAQAPSSHILSIWSDAGERLAMIEDAPSGPSGWREIPLGVPLLVAAGARYRVSYTVKVPESYGRNVTRPADHAPGLSIDPSGWYGAGDSFPSSSGGGWFYYADVVFIAAAQRRYPRFTGRISDISIEWEAEQPIARVIAVSDLAIIGRRIIGDSPWPAELDGQRVNRALTLAGFPPDPLRTDPGSLTVLARDVDRQPALAVAHDAADDGDGVLWQARDGAILYADAEHRRGSMVAAEFMACDLGAGAGWGISLEGLVNDATVRYGAAEPQAEARATTDAAERYAAALSTRIADLADAQKRADAMVARQAEPAWILSGLELELAAPWFGPAETGAILELEVHDLISVTGLPAGSPETSALLWVEGWAERVDPGSWSLSLFTSDYCRTAAFARWDEVSHAITWATVPLAQTWDGSSCIRPRPMRGRWNDAPASLRWDTIEPAAITWDTWI